MPKARVTRKRQIVNHLGNVVMAIVSASLITAPALAATIDPAEAAAQVVASEGGKEALNAALKVARGKPALSLAALITCVACVPAAGAAASPGLCIACGILVAKTLG
jgi:hypothetical protein